MISVNGASIDFTLFPDNTTSFRYNPCCFEYNILWRYDDDMPARIRMATLYAVAQSLPNGGRVANTCNMSEDYVGYSTKYGDSAGDFSPLSHLMVHEVREIGHKLPISFSLVDKTPSDGLCGKTDEDNLGFTYDQLDQYIMSGTSGDKSIDEKISSLHVRNLHKLKLMPAYGGQP